MVLCASAWNASAIFGSTFYFFYFFFILFLTGHTVRSISVLGTTLGIVYYRHFCIFFFFFNVTVFGLHTQDVILKSRMLGGNKLINK